MEKLTKELALKAIKEIENISSDYENAHEKEDDLYYWFIYCASQGWYDKDEVIEIAKILETTSDIEFGRWTA